MDDGMLQALAAFPVGNVAWAGLVTLGIVSIIRGWLIPRSWHLDRITDKDTQITSLREALATSEEAKDLLMKQNGDLIRANETTVRVMESLREQATKSVGG